MPRSISLSLQMHSPCQENWNNMEPGEQGRFCNTCQKTVIDFTGFTDQEIFQYFIKNPFPVCGKMLASQNDRRYEEVQPKVNRHLSPIAASLLTLAAITTEAAPATPLKPGTNLAQQPTNKQSTATLTDSVIISGTVKNDKGIPLENVEIIFMDSKMLSDADGNFQFTLPAPINKQTVIQFSYPRLDKEVRSYHPIMGSTSYEVTLHAPTFSSQYYTMGGIGPVYCLPDSLSTFYFRSGKLDAKTTTLLEGVVTVIKNNPSRKFIIKSLYNTSKSKADKLSKLIKSFIEEKNGIDPGRVFVAVPVQQSKINTEVIIEIEEWND